MSRNLDLVALIGSSVVLTPSGEPTATLVGACPFCGRPSFRVHAARQLWQCFACGIGGDLEGWRRRVLRGESTP